MARKKKNQTQAKKARQAAAAQQTPSTTPAPTPATPPTAAPAPSGAKRHKFNPIGILAGKVEALRARKQTRDRIKFDNKERVNNFKAFMAKKPKIIDSGSHKAFNETVSKLLDPKEGFFNNPQFVRMQIRGAPYTASKASKYADFFNDPKPDGLYNNARALPGSPLEKKLHEPFDFGASPEEYPTGRLPGEKAVDSLGSTRAQFRNTLPPSDMAYSNVTGEGKYSRYRGTNHLPYTKEHLDKPINELNVRRSKLTADESVLTSHKLGLHRVLENVQNLSDSDQQIAKGLLRNEVGNSSRQRYTPYRGFNLDSVLGGIQGDEVDKMTKVLGIGVGYGAKETLEHGWGMGMKNAVAASRAEHFGRFLSFANPVGAAARSGWAESLGFVTEADRIRSKTATNFLGRMMPAAAPIAAGGLVAFGMYDMQDPGEIASNLLAGGAMINGFRMGKALGATLTPQNASVLRPLGMGVLGTAGAIGGIAAVAGAYGILNDATSNDSHIRKLSKKIATKEMYARTDDTRQSLTARQQTLNKLAKSGLNDRAQLLGNEALALKGVI